MEIPADGDITATITFAGLDWETKGDDTSYFTAPVDLAGALRYSFKEVTNIRLNGVDGGTGFCVDTFNIQFNNNMQTQRCIGTGSAFAGANIPTTFTPSGQITLSWSCPGECRPGTDAAVSLHFFVERNVKGVDEEACPAINTI